MWKGITVSKGRGLWLLRGMRVTSSCGTAPKAALCPIAHEKGLFFHCRSCAFGVPCDRPKLSLQTPPKHILGKAPGFPFFECLLEISPSPSSALRASALCLTALKFWDGAFRAWNFGTTLQASCSVDLTHLEEDPFRSLRYVCRVAHLVSYADSVTVSTSGFAHKEEEKHCKSTD